jgi:hypothetical protein
MPDSDKWTARRGSQGDNWRWEGEAPPEPEANMALGRGDTPSGRRAEKPGRRIPGLALGAWWAALLAIMAAAIALIATPARQLWGRATSRRAESERQDFTGFAAVLGIFTLIAAVAFVVVLLASALSDDDSDGGLPPSATPTATTVTPGPTESPSTTLIPPVSATPAPTPTATSDVLVPPGPEGDVALGMWANELDAWWFGTLPEGSAVYHPGDEIPWLLRWDSQPGAAYVVEIRYDCRAGDTPLIDLLTGVEYAHDAIFLAEWGPGTTRPDAAVPVPDTADLDIDDTAPGLLYLYGGTFSLLPDGPDPASGCTDERSITMPVRATGDTMILMGSAWLAQPDDHAGASAADATSAIGLSAEIEGAGDAETAVSPGVLQP